MISKSITVISLSLFLITTSSYARNINKEFCNGGDCYAQNKAALVNFRAGANYAYWRPLPNGQYQYQYQNQNQNQRHGWWFNSNSDGNRDNNRYNYYQQKENYYDRSSWIAPVPSKGPANSRGTVVFSPRSLTWAAYDSDGDLVKSGHAVGGSNYCPDINRPCHTPIGRFHVYAKGDADCVSKIYPIGIGGAPMPHCMYFSGGYAIHGSYEVPDYNASHGCIRLHPPEAQWLHENFVKVGTVVVVKPY